MAVLLSVHKQAETETTVSYFYGFGEDRGNEIIVVDKATMRPIVDGEPVEGEVLSRKAGFAMAAIAAGRRKHGGWPEGYVYQA